MAAAQGLVVVVVCLEEEIITGLLLLEKAGPG
jgi:hypothetical protein